MRHHLKYKYAICIFIFSVLVTFLNSLEASNEPIWDGIKSGLAQVVLKSNTEREHLAGLCDHSAVSCEVMP